MKSSLQKVEQQVEPPKLSVERVGRRVERRESVEKVERDLKLERVKITEMKKGGE